MKKQWQQARETLKGQFTVLALICMLLSIGLAVYTSLALRTEYSALDTIVNGSVPSVNAAQGMGQFIDDVDARAADYLATAGLTDLQSCTVVTSLTGSVGSGIKRVHNCDQLNIDAEIILANQQLFNAAHNVTFPGERTAVERITAGFEEYVGYLTVMEKEYEQAANEADINDPHIKNAYQAYVSAGAVLHSHIQRAPSIDESSLPECHIGIDHHLAHPNEWVHGGIDANIDCLNDINYTALQDAYQSTQNMQGMLVILSGLFCLVFCILLFFATVRMTTVTHRLINIGLLPALLLGIIFSIIIFNLVSSMNSRFNDITQNDYDSIYYAAQLKRYGTDANADESRWLVAQAFKDQNSVAHWASEWEMNTHKVENLIQRAHSNRTWSEEDPPLAAMDKSWKNYFTIDSQIRDKANAQDLKGADELSTGESNSAFGTFSQAVDDLSRANEGHYQSTLSDTQNSLMSYIPLSAILFPIIGLSALWGISQRLKDF